MSDNLKVAAESGFRIYGDKIQAPYSNEDVTGLIEAYTSRILAEQQAAHAAEIARLKEEIDALQESWRQEKLVVESRNQMLFDANAACAMKDDALRTFERNYLRYDFNCGLYYSTHVKPAISASQQQVSEWESKKLEPSRQQVAMLAKEMQMMLLPATAEGVTATDICKAISARAETVLANTQATAEAYEREHAAKVLEEAKSNIETMNAVMKVSVPDVIDSLQQMADEALAANKKEGE